MRFVHLHVHSHYSLLDGLSKIEDLVERAQELKMDAMALTDHGVLYGAIEFYQKFKKAGLKPVVGQEFYITPGDMHEKRSRADDTRYHLTVLARNNAGWRNLIKLSTVSHLEGFYYKPRIDHKTLAQYSSGLVILSGCLNGEIPKAILNSDYKRARELAKEYETMVGKGNFFLEIQRHRKLPEQDIANEGLINLSRELDIPLVATCDAHYPRREDAETQDVLVCIQTNQNVAKEERLSMKDNDFSLKSSDEMSELFADIPEAIENTGRIADMCTVDIELGRTRLPSFEVPPGYDENTYLQELCDRGLEKRFDIDVKSPAADEKTKQILDRVAYEMNVIAKMGFASYFLIVQDFVNWAKHNGVVVGPGRGSAAGSMVSYILNITNIDPIEYNLLFERFLNPERVSMPDIDMDFADARRDDVLSYVTDKYGADHVAQIITFGTMAARAAVRDAGRALGFAYSFCDRLAKLIPPMKDFKESMELSEELKQLYDTDPQVKKLINVAMRLEGVARHASTHACGVVISAEPLTDQCPLQLATSSSDNDDDTRKIVVTQFEGSTVETLGLLKMDFLGLKNLTIIEETLELINKHHGETIDIDTLPLKDKKTFGLLREGKTTGVFQFESAGMKRYMKELKPTDLEDLIALVALFRPGPMELIPSYIARKHGKEKIIYLSDHMEPILKNTHGIMIYQEQAMQIARDLAGYTLGEADTLRKAIGKKIKSLLDEQQEKLVKGMVKNGIAENVAKEIWELFPPFARYGFNRSHAACYAMIGYQTAYLKAHYPSEFMAALLNSDYGDVERIAFLVDEAKDMTIPVLPPDIQQSQEKFSIIVTPDKTPAEEKHLHSIRFGLSAVKNVGDTVVAALVRVRDTDGSFKNLQDVLERVDSKDLNKKSLEALIKSGAFDSFGYDRAVLLASMENILQYIKEMKKDRDSSQSSLFEAELHIAKTLKMEQSEPAQKEERLAWEKELLGLYISEHPLEEFKKLFASYTTPLKDAEKHVKRLVTVGGMLSRLKKIITKTGKPMFFGELNDLTGKIEVVMFPSFLEKYGSVIKDGVLVLMKGKIDKGNGNNGNGNSNYGDSPKFIADALKELKPEDKNA